eukprot:SM000134S26932  [mRNA]  locus=s134:47525:52159:- [translate_table: standard]
MAIACLRLPDAFQATVREGLIAKVLKHLTLKRSTYASRVEISTHAEAFAALIDIGFINIAGGRVEQPACWAFHCSGGRIPWTVVEARRSGGARQARSPPFLRCCASLRTAVPQSQCWARPLTWPRALLSCLRSLLPRCGPSLRTSSKYDTTNIEETIGWTRQRIATFSAAVCELHTRVQALAHCQLAAIGPTRCTLTRRTRPQAPRRNWAVRRWSRLELAADVCGAGLRAVRSYFGHRNAVFAMAYDHSRDQLISGSKDSTLIIWSTTGQAGEWPPHAGIQVVKTLDISQHYACSMDIDANHQTLLVASAAKVTGLYINVDADTEARAAADHYIDWLKIQYPTLVEENTFRMLGAAGKGQKVVMHDAMVTCLDCGGSNGHEVLSGSMHAHIRSWDLRALLSPARTSATSSSPVGTAELDDSAVVKVALCGASRGAAVSTFNGLCYVEHSSGGSTLFGLRTPAFADGRHVGLYHNLRWVNSHSTLFAAGNDQHIDETGRLANTCGSSKLALLCNSAQIRRRRRREDVVT